MPALRFRVLGLAALLAAVAGCDFTPTLDIETPEYEPGVVVRSILVADSVAAVRVGSSWDPYRGRPDVVGRTETVEAIVTLERDGQPAEVLVFDGQRCDDYSRPPGPDGQPPTYPCGAYRGTTPIEAGQTYTVRVEATGLPAATATVTVPRRPGLAVTQEIEGSTRRFRVRLTDPSGGGDLYGLSLLRTFRYVETVCESPEQSSCAEFDRIDRGLTSFDTSDPVLLSAAAEIDGGITFVVFPDQTFDGQEKAFTMTADSRYSPSDRNSEMTVQVAALSGDIYDTYRIEYFSGGDENPFAEPVNLPSNVVGGYGLVGAVTLAEVTFEGVDP